MYYFALLQTPQRELTPEQGQAEMAAYTDFHARERAAIRAGDALAPDGVRVSGGAEVWPIVYFNQPDRPSTDTDWLALLLEPADQLNEVGSPEWEAHAALHQEFGAGAGQHIVGGAPLHAPSTATTVRVRDGEVLLTDGPFAEGAEVANGFYLLSAADRDEAAKIASMIPASAVQLRRLAGIAGL
jgi:hypothetical protein